MTTTADSTLIDEAVIDGLRPQARRYDVAVSDELVLAVLPNGAKTWTWVYDGPGQPHRQTLGVYPEMSLEQARKARASAAQTRGQRGAPAAYVIRDGRIEPSAGKLNWQWPLVGAAGLLGGGILIGWLLLGDRDPDLTIAETGPDMPSGTMTLDTRIDPSRQEAAQAPPADAAPLPVETPADTPPDAAVEQTPVAERQTRQAAPAAVPVETPVEPTADTPPVEAPVEQAQAATVAMPLQTPAADRPPVDAPVEQASQAATVAVRLETPIEPPAADRPPVETPIETPVEQTTAAPDRPIVGARIGAGSFEPGVTDPRVARAQLTTAMIGREPADAPGPVLVGNGEDIQTYYFFTELRSLAGQRIRHRWIAGDRIQAEVPFNVGEAWRWRIFSSKRLLATMAGPWRVQVVTEDDVVIYDYAFEFQP